MVFGQAEDEDCRPRIRQIALGAAVAVILALTSPAEAEVLAASANGFDVREAVHIAATATRVYAAIVEPKRWWDSAHTYSGGASNLTLEPRAGGCWCETLPCGGSVQHLIVVYAAPGKTLRLRGALGPLQGLGVDGAMTWAIAPSPEGSALTLDYVVGGYARGGLDKLAGPADGVLAAQLARLKQFIETGSPEVPDRRKP